MEEPSEERDQPEWERHVLKVLASFQTLEFGLKTCIALSYKIIKARTAGDLEFAYSIADVENSPLSTLTKTYRRLSKPSEVHGRLAKLCDVRNDLAHRALLYSNPSLRDVLDVNMNERHLTLALANKELQEVMVLVATDMDRLIKLANKLQSNA